MSIWQHKSISDLINKQNQLSLKEGNTNTFKLYLDKYELKKFGIIATKTHKVTLKLETMNPNQSFKDRSLAYQISHYLQKGESKLLISSSGNAAVSACAYVSLTDMKLAIFVSNKVNPEKLNKILKYVKDNDNITINYSDKAKSDAIKYSKAGNFINLRGSHDDTAVVGFRTISYELINQVPTCDAIFVPCSSGTSTYGIYQGYKDLEAGIPAINIVQTTKVNSIAREFDIVFDEEDSHVSDAIVDRVAKRKNQIIEAIEETNGNGYVINNDEIKAATKFLYEKTKLPFLTYNGVLSFAGFIKSIKKKRFFDDPVCIISGI